ncbi:MAG: hypothetical protein U5Q16_11135 [Gammaproteobacteria bacterium]|nr:hypothetical protein [Gammaproteobacteria bacterium]
MCVILAAGIGFGLFLGVVYGLLTPIEWVLLPALLLATAGTAVAAGAASKRRFLGSTRLLGFASGIYLLIGAANHLLWQADPAASLVYVVWFPVYHVLIFAVVDDDWARRLSLGVLSSGIALQTAAVYVRPAWNPVDPAVTACIVLLFAQIATIAMLQIMVRYRTRYAASQARAITLQQGERELKAALDEARAARQDAEEQHRFAHDAHQRLATILNALDVGTALFHRDGRMLLCNRVLADFLDEFGIDAGQSPTSMEVAAALDQFGAQVPEDPESRWTERFRQVVDGSDAHGQMWLPDGRSFLASGSLLDSGDGLFTVVETTEIERSRHALTRLQKMESLGSLVGGVAHDFDERYLRPARVLRTVARCRRRRTSADHRPGHRGHRPRQCSDAPAPQFRRQRRQRNSIGRSAGRRAGAGACHGRGNLSRQHIPDHRVGRGTAAGPG